jgi:hypothetical protein
MHQIDEFESRFRRAEREAYVFADVPIDSVLLLTDGSRDEANALRSSLASFLPRIATAASWRILSTDDYHNVGELLERIDAEQTDLVITYRHLQEQSFVPQHSLGVYLDVLTQATAIPVLLLPGTLAEPISLTDRVSQRVMVVADHIAGDARLINYGARMCTVGGTMWLCHVEDDAVFEHYIRAIERIPEIDSDQARVLIGAQLEKDAANYIETCIGVLKEVGPNVAYHADVTRGHHLTAYRQLIDEHAIDLVVANTKDEDQLAMHGMTYSLSVEMLDVPLLLL